MNINQEFRLGLLLIKGLSVDELNELTTLLKIEREEYHKEKLTLTSVRNQREFLITFLEHMDKVSYTEETCGMTHKELIRSFLK